MTKKPLFDNAADFYTAFIQTESSGKETIIPDILDLKARELLSRFNSVKGDTFNKEAYKLLRKQWATIMENNFSESHLYVEDVLPWVCRIGNEVGVLPTNKCYEDVTDYRYYRVSKERWLEKLNADRITVPSLLMPELPNADTIYYVPHMVDEAVIGSVMDDVGEPGAVVMINYSTLKSIGISTIPYMLRPIIDNGKVAEVQYLLPAHNDILRMTKLWLHKPTAHPPTALGLAGLLTDEPTYLPVGSNAPLTFEEIYEIMDFIWG